MKAYISLLVPLLTVIAICAGPMYGYGNELYMSEHARYYIIKLKTYDTAYDYIKSFNTVYSSLCNCSWVREIGPEDLEEHVEKWGLTAVFHNIEGEASGNITIAPGQIYDPVRHKLFRTVYTYSSDTANITYTVVYNTITVRIYRKTAAGSTGGAPAREELIDRARMLLERLDMSPESLDVRYVKSSFYATGTEGPEGFTPSKYHVSFYVYINGVPLTWQPSVVFDSSGNIVFVSYILLDIDEITEVEVYTPTEISSIILDNASSIKGPYYWTADGGVEGYQPLENATAIIPVYYYKRTDGSDCFYSAIKGFPKLLLEAHYATAGDGSPGLPPLTPPEDYTENTAENPGNTGSTPATGGGDNVLAQATILLPAVAVMAAAVLAVFIARKK